MISHKTATFVTKDVQILMISWNIGKCHIHMISMLADFMLIQDIVSLKLLREWSQKFALGVIPENCSGSDQRKLLQEWSLKTALGVIPEKCSGSDPWKLLWEWSLKTAPGVIPETSSGITPRHLYGEWSQGLLLGVILWLYSINQIPSLRFWGSGI